MPDRPRRVRIPRSYANRTVVPSVWSIQVNTLLAPQTGTEQRHLNERLRQTLDQVLGNKQAMSYILYPRPEWGNDAGRMNFGPNGLLEKMRFFRGQIEIGSQQHRVHAHTMLWVTHRSNIGINTDAIRALLRNAWNRLGPVIQEMEGMTVPVAQLQKWYRSDSQSFNVRVRFMRLGEATRAFWYSNKSMSGLKQHLAKESSDDAVLSAMTDDLEATVADGRRAFERAEEEGSE